MIFITGDTHADFHKFSKESFWEQLEMTKEDFVIICGDFGIWRPDASENWWFNWLNDKPFTTLFVDGNHENFDRLYSNEFQTVDFHGGAAHKIRDSIFHLKRGEVFELQGKTFFAFGGASSHDIDDGILDEKDFPSHDKFIKEIKHWDKQGKMFRVNHLSWWKQELPSIDEMNHGREVLQAIGNKVDFVISHCLPQSAASVLSNGLYKPDVLTSYFESLLQSGLEFNRWFCGHYHVDRQILGKFIALYDQIIQIV